MKRATYLALAAGLLAGFAFGRLFSPMVDESESAPEDWIARVGDQYVTQAEFESELSLRSGGRGGQTFSNEQRRALLDQLMYRRALVARALDAGVDQRPEVRRSRDQLLINQVLQAELRPRQESVDITPAEIEAFYAEHADEYSVPARRRVAMIFLALGENASAETRAIVEERAESIRTQALELPSNVPDFAGLAREHTDHQASRYRGGVIGWVSEGDPSRYSHPEIVVQTANGMTEPGDVSEVVEDERGLYLVRLVNYEPLRTRSLEELSDGIRQRLLRNRFLSVENDFREETLARTEIEIRPGGLEMIQGPDQAEEEPSRLEPPSLPTSQTEGN